MDQKIKEALIAGIATRPKQATRWHSERFLWAANHPAIPEISLKEWLDGPCDFLRISSNVNCRMFFLNADEDAAGDAKLHEDFEGVTGAVPRIYRNENIITFLLTPAVVPFLVNIYASRIVPSLSEEKALGEG